MESMFLHRRALAALLITTLAAHAQHGAPAVTIDSGRVEGIAVPALPNGGAFLGIPYAAQPVGDLRWRPPQPAASWAGVRAATEYGHDCMQLPFPSDAAPLGTAPSEDCLVLNIWSPAKRPAAKLPVMVWIYGGGYVNGGSSPAVYSGAQFAKRGILFVSFNYRLGRFGFFAYPALDRENPGDPHGNYGFMDQIAALRWVKENIRAFGGDPARVAIAGQSAGAMSVADLVASPLTKGLFSAAIADSGIGGRGVPVKTLAEAEKAGEAFAASKKADSLAALRAMRAEDLLAAQGAGLRFAPVVDGWVLPDDPLTLTTERGRDNDVPVITGFQANDFLLGSRAGSAADYEKDAHQTYGTMADEFLKLYPAVTDDAVKAAVAESGRDRMRATSP